MGSELLKDVGVTSRPGRLVARVRRPRENTRANVTHRLEVDELPGHVCPCHGSDHPAPATGSPDLNDCSISSALTYLPVSPPRKFPLIVLLPDPFGPAIIRIRGVPELI